MQIFQVNELEIEESGCGFEEKEASLKTENLSLFFELVSSKFYSDPTGSIVREITSNCFDSHTEAKVDDAVVIKGGYEEGSYYIIFKDVGLGMSPTVIDGVFLQYLSSTKRNTNDLIGGFGFVTN